MLVKVVKFVIARLSNLYKIMKNLTDVRCATLDPCLGDQSGYSIRGFVSFDRVDKLGAQTLCIWRVIEINTTRAALAGRHHKN